MNEPTKITQEEKETATGTMFITTYPKGILNPYVAEVRVTHITNWKKMMDIMNSCLLP